MQRSSIALQVQWDGALQAQASSDEGEGDAAQGAFMCMVRNDQTVRDIIGEHPRIRSSGIRVDIRVARIRVPASDRVAPSYVYVICGVHV